MDYYEVTSELDAREILRYLNNLGIHNINGEVLKYFITDLKKFIKYDLQQRNGSYKQHKYSDVQGPERLHSVSTFASRTRSKVQDGHIQQCSRECQTARKPLSLRNIHSAPNLGQKKPDDKPLRRACSCVKVEKKHEITSQAKDVVNSNNNLIKVPKPQIKKKCDPVSLYHYYNSMWEKYKSHVPGENDWSELRWSIRQKMAGNVVSKQSQNKVPEVQVKTKVVKT